MCYHLICAIIIFILFLLSTLGASEKIFIENGIQTDSLQLLHEEYLNIIRKTLQNNNYK